MNKIIRRRAIPDIIILRPIMQVIVDSRILPRPGRIHISVDRDVNLHLAAATGADVGSEGGEADVRVRDLVGHELGAQFLAGGGEVGVGEDAGGAEAGVGR
jgi:hypothetical protein